MNETIKEGCGNPHSDQIHQDLNQGSEVVLESSNALELYHSLYQDVICHGGDISFDIIQ